MAAPAAASAAAADPYLSAASSLAVGSDLENKISQVETPTGNAFQALMAFPRSCALSFFAQATPGQMR